MVEELRAGYCVNVLKRDIDKRLHALFPKMDKSEMTDLAQITLEVQVAEIGAVHRALEESVLEYASGVYESSIEGKSPVSLDKPIYSQASFFDDYFLSISDA